MRKEKKSSGIYLAVFIALIMILSVIGFMTTREEKQAYGKFSFSEKNNQWSTKTQNGELLSYYLPQDVEQIAVPEQAKSLILNTKMLYITYDPKDEDVETLATAQYSLGLALEQLGVYSVNSVTKEGSGLQITCENATAFVPVILIQTAQENSLNLNNNCLILSGNPVMTSDRLKYSLYGVIN